MYVPDHHILCFSFIYTPSHGAIPIINPTLYTLIHNTMETNEHHDAYTLKFVLAGDSGVGKTSLISRFIVCI